MMTGFTRFPLTKPQKAQEAQKRTIVLFVPFGLFGCYLLGVALLESSGFFFT
jgi:hypothetical protein